MKDGKKCKICLLFIMVLLLCCACEEYVNMGPQAEEMAKEYIEGKYGDVLSYAGIEQMTTGMIKGEAYWEVYFTDKEGEKFTVCVCLSEDNELYIDYETYYNHYIEPMMCEWLAAYLEEAGLREYVLYCRENGFSTDWSVNYGVDEILNKLMTDEQMKGWLTFRLRIPEREREVLNSQNLKQNLSQIQLYSDKMIIETYIYDNETYAFLDEDRWEVNYVESGDLLEEDTNE